MLTVAFYLCFILALFSGLTYPLSWLFNVVLLLAAVWFKLDDILEELRTSNKYAHEQSLREELRAHREVIHTPDGADVIQ